MSPDVNNPATPSVYLFLDEGGNLVFSPKGTAYFTMSVVRMRRPFPLDSLLAQLRFDLIESGMNKEYFHATEDEQSTRDNVFRLIQTALPAFRVDAIVVEKRKAAPKVREVPRFYPEIMAYLLRYAINSVIKSGEYSKVFVITDRLPIQQKKRAIEKAIKTTLAKMLPRGMPYRVIHHDSKSCCGLQIADYLNWAIFRKWESGDRRSYDLIRSAVRSEFEIYRHGHTNWY